MINKIDSSFFYIINIIRWTCNDPISSNVLTKCRINLQTPIHRVLTNIVTSIYEYEHIKGVTLYDKST